jgi:hypothetical protein
MPNAATSAKKTSEGIGSATGVTVTKAYAATPDAILMQANQRNSRSHANFTKHLQFWTFRAEPLWKCRAKLSWYGRIVCRADLVIRSGENSGVDGDFPLCFGIGRGHAPNEFTTGQDKVTVALPTWLAGVRVVRVARVPGFEDSQFKTLFVITPGVFPERLKCDSVDWHFRPRPKSI